MPDLPRMDWRAVNSWIYRCGHGALPWLQPLRAARRRIRRRAHSTPNGPLLLLGDGRLGDALLAAAFSRHYRAWFGAVVALGRPETAAVLAPHVDRFVPFDPRAAAGDALGGEALATVAGLGCRAVLGDAHLFHAGRPQLLLAAELGVPTVLYDGWIDRSLQAPVRPWPAGATVVPARSKPVGDTSPERAHVFFDLLHYHAAALPALGADLEAAPLPTRPELPPALTGDPGLDLPGGYVACHASSSQPKKDWPPASFAALLASTPGVPFAVLGTDRTPLPPLPHVTDLRGRTTVAQAVAVAAGARAFVGVDSGLAHAAAIAAVPTVVVMPQATAGLFFPYPAAFGAHVEAVRSPAHADCAGCGGLCRHEPIWRSRRCGFPCLRAVTVAAVAAALQRALSQPRPIAAPE